MLINKKKSALLPLGNIRRLPVAFQPTFYSKVVDLVKGVNEEMLADSVAVLADQVAELNHIVEVPHGTDNKLVDDAVKRVQQFLVGTRYLLKGYMRSNNPQEVTLATKALDLLNNLPNRVLRTNASELLTALVNNFDTAWKPADLTGTFMESLRTQLSAVANDYQQVYQNRVANGAAHKCFSEKKEEVFATFEFFYMNLFVCVGLTGDVALSELQSKVNELIVIYTSISKGHVTRNVKKEQEGENHMTDESTAVNATDESVETTAASETVADAPKTNAGECA